ncbi:alpha/beta hydrolase [Kineosporia sp. NBRC 101731]|uniref:alpha/beta fold hydrolase n=1 Tax=Kineosporia sp. NBRC 101731 TaxID=3032199 RepID=UPI0024A1B238|nr:alpha/beta hydrolase [Kineosporia sp. NBRC 101731]GLY32332.1 3-oxoadipate enol-lactone hydrolase [Kineosporia sp. NBRC 101731]
MPTISVGSAKIPYRVTGEGPVLVLVHGTGPNAEIQFGHLLERFAGNTVVVPDLSGTEPVIDDGAPLTVERLAEQVLAVIDDLGADQVDLAGFSLGSPVAVAVAARRPEVVRRLVLVAGWDLASADEYQRNMFRVWRRLADLDDDAFGRYSTFTGFSHGFLNTIGREQVEAIVPNLKPTPNLIRQIDLCQTLDVRELLPQVRAQTLVVGLADDATVPVAASGRLHAAIPGSQYQEVASGHVVPLEQPDAFVAAIRDFIQAA